MLHILSIGCSFFIVKGVIEWSYAISVDGECSYVLSAAERQRCILNCYGISKTTIDVEHKLFHCHFISMSVHSSGRQEVAWFCRGGRTWQNTYPHSSLVSHSLWYLHQQSGATLANVPSSQSCQHINKPWFNDPWHHICLCVWLYHVAVWQTQLPKMDPSVTWKEPYSLCLTLLSTECVRVCVRDKGRVILFYGVTRLTN